MMVRAALVWIGVAWVGAGSIHAAQQQSSLSSPAPGSQYRAVLNRYCVTCHNAKLKTADLMLDKMDVENPPEGAEAWEKVIRKLRTGTMPPTGVPRPDAATYSSLATYLETSIDRAAAAEPNPGRPAVHRLNRAEYANAIRDLLGVNIDGESLLPADDPGTASIMLGLCLRCHRRCWNDICQPRARSVASLLETLLSALALRPTRLPSFCFKPTAWMSISHSGRAAE